MKLRNFRKKSTDSDITVLARPGLKQGTEIAYTWLLYTKIQAEGINVVEFSHRRALFSDYDVLHLHWPDMLFNRPETGRVLLASLLQLFYVAWARLWGAKVYWTVHNFSGHESWHPRLEKAFFRMFTAMLSGYFVLSESSREDAMDLYPVLCRKPWFLVPLGHFREMYDGEISTEQARSRLGISPDDHVIVFFGSIRPYKNVPHLVRVFREVPDRDLRLIVAGRPADPSLEATIRKAAEGDSRILLVLQRVEDSQVAVYMQAADTVVLPFTRILNSASLFLALSFGKRVLVPRTRTFVELQEQVGEEWVAMYEGELTSEILQETIDHGESMDQDVFALLSRIGWETTIRNTIKAYAGEEAR